MRIKGNLLNKNRLMCISILIAFLLIAMTFTPVLAAELKAASETELSIEAISEEEENSGDELFEQIQELLDKGAISEEEAEMLILKLKRAISDGGLSDAEKEEFQSIINEYKLSLVEENIEESECKLCGVSSEGLELNLLAESMTDEDKIEFAEKLTIFYENRHIFESIEEMSEEEKYGSYLPFLADEFEAMALTEEDPELKYNLLNFASSARTLISSGSFQTSLDIGLVAAKSDHTSVSSQGSDDRPALRLMPKESEEVDNKTNNPDCYNTTSECLNDIWEGIINATLENISKVKEGFWELVEKVPTFPEAYDWWKNNASKTSKGIICILVSVGMFAGGNLVIGALAGMTSLATLVQSGLGLIASFTAKNFHWLIPLTIGGIYIVSDIFDKLDTNLAKIISNVASTVVNAGINIANITLNEINNLIISKHCNGKNMCKNYTDDVNGNNSNNNTCFLSGTPILRADGSYTGIENIRSGDQVIAINMETKKPGIATVIEAKQHTPEEMTDYYLEIEVEINGKIIENKLKVTPNHELFVKASSDSMEFANTDSIDGYIYIEAGKIKVGDSFMGATVISIEKIYERTVTYDLILEAPYENYVVALGCERQLSQATALYQSGDLSGLAPSSSGSQLGSLGGTGEFGLFPAMPAGMLIPLEGIAHTLTAPKANSNSAPATSSATTTVNSSPATTTVATSSSTQILLDSSPSNTNTLDSGTNPI